MKKEIEKLNPMKITDAETGKVYELDFDRAAVLYAERKGFKVAETGDYPTTMIPDLFAYAFRKNHPNVPRNKIDEIRESLGGLTGEELGRLSELYNRAAISNVVVLDEEARKNGRMTVEL